MKETILKCQLMKICLSSRDKDKRVVQSYFLFLYYKTNMDIPIDIEYQEMNEEIEESSNLGI